MIERFSFAAEGLVVVAVVRVRGEGTGFLRRWGPQGIVALDVSDGGVPAVIHHTEIAGYVLGPSLYSHGSGLDPLSEDGSVLLAEGDDEKSILIYNPLSGELSRNVRLDPNDCVQEHPLSAEDCRNAAVSPISMSPGKSRVAFRPISYSGTSVFPQDGWGGVLQSNALGVVALTEDRITIGNVAPFDPPSNADFVNPRFESIFAWMDERTAITFDASGMLTKWVLPA